jgi:hypothetical protein
MVILPRWRTEKARAGEGRMLMKLFVCTPTADDMQQKKRSQRTESINHGPRERPKEKKSKTGEKGSNEVQEHTNRDDASR